MKLYLLMPVLLIILFSGCIQTGEITEPVSQGDTELNETINETSGTVADEPEDPCMNAVCGEIITTCPDGFISTCTNPCDSKTGECMPCKPDCTGHENGQETEQLEGTDCGIWCDPTECRILDENMCECMIMLFCDGNGICEESEYPGSDDCPECSDGDPCTQDYYDYGLKSCVYETTSPCCGNLDCEDNEDEENCPEDCLEEQVGDVSIIALNETAEWVEFEGYNVIMTNWTLSDWKERHVYTFPEWFMINGKVKLHRGLGDDSDTDLFWQKKSYVWNNDGDNATLRDNNGEIVDFYNYP